MLLQKVDAHIRGDAVETAGVHDTRPGGLGGFLMRGDHVSHPMHFAG